MAFWDDYENGGGDYSNDNYSATDLQNPVPQYNPATTYPQPDSGFNFSNLGDLFSSGAKFLDNNRATIGNIIGGAGAIAGSMQNRDQQNRINNTIGQLQDPGLQRLRDLRDQTYIDPSSYYNGPEGQALSRVITNALERKDAAAGRFSNPIGRAAELQDRMMAGLAAYRSGIGSQISTAHGGYGNLSGLFDRSYASNPMNPIFAGLGSIFGPKAPPPIAQRP